jgi:hydrogenase expression/formation protein HypE
MQDRYISLAHGNGGRHMRELIDRVFARHLANPELDTRADAVPLALAEGDVMFTTDGFTVQPLEFPGGNIGVLAVHGTINDLAVAGAEPLYLGLNAFIEEGMEIDQLERIVAALASAASTAGVRVVAGDTKVLRRGEGSGLYLATTGVGIRKAGVRLGLDCIEPGDRILISGPVGDHGIAVLLAREEFGLRGELKSDADSVLPLTRVALNCQGLRFMRDPTRGGLATVCHEISQASRLGVRLLQTEIPIRESVQSVCDMLGYDPLYLACEGRVVAVVAEAHAAELLAAWRRLPQGGAAALVGRVERQCGEVLLETQLGGERLVDELEDDPLPRIC